MKTTIAEKVLRFIASSPDGRRLGEIQRFIYEHNYPGKSGEKRKTWKRRYYRDGRTSERPAEVEVPVYQGYWGTNLTGNPRTTGILESFCIKTKDRRYVVVEPIKPPFFRRQEGPQTKTYGLNVALREYDYRLREALAAKCPCGRANTYDEERFFVPDGKAHVVCHARLYNADCQGRVWTADGLLTSLSADQVYDFWMKICGIGISWEQREDVMACYVINHVVTKPA